MSSTRPLNTWTFVVGGTEDGSPNTLKLHEVITELEHAKDMVSKARPQAGAL